VALTGHLQVANKTGAASATPTAASSGPLPKAPGSAGGYLLSPGKTVVVHNFTFLDTNIIEPKLGASKRTAEKIEQNKHDIVSGTAETVDASLVDDTGKYHPMSG
jgi:hypothetical protein